MNEARKEDRREDASTAWSKLLTKKQFFESVREETQPTNRHAHPGISGPFDDWSMRKARDAQRMAGVD